MRRDDKLIKYTGIGLVFLAIIVIGLLVYSKNLNDKAKSESLSSERIASILNNTTNESEITNTKEASSQMGRTVNETTNEMNSNTTNNEANNTISNTTNNIVNSNTLTTNRIMSEGTNEAETTNATSSKKEESKAELEFAMPVEGEIVRDFAMDNLIYSETLQEWVTHTGIDIKADKTTVVKSAESGTVKTIKNDPRFGLTITIEHENGFQTVYSNLLSSEFVVEGEKVEKGQSLGTVGNTAAFEITDEPHLHFEILKDSVAIDPSQLIK